MTGLPYGDIHLTVLHSSRGYHVYLGTEYQSIP
jgi:hypothetical protein